MNECKKHGIEMAWRNDASRKAGRRLHCAECDCASSRRYCAAHPDKKRESNRRWAKANPDKKRENSRRWDAENPDKKRENNRRWDAENPEKVKAHIAVERAVRSGVLVRQPCEECGSEKVDAHHWSYKPEHRLDVHWMCRRHHTQFHAFIDSI